MSTPALSSAASTHSCHFGPQVWKPLPVFTKANRADVHEPSKLLSDSSSSFAPRFNVTTTSFGGSVLDRRGSEFRKLNPNLSMFVLIARDEFRVGAPPPRQSKTAQFPLQDVHQSSCAASVDVLRKSMKRTGRLRKTRNMAVKPLHLIDVSDNISWAISCRKPKTPQNLLLPLLESTSNCSSNAVSPLRDSGDASCPSSSFRGGSPYKRSGSMERARFYQGLPTVSNASRRQRTQILVTRKATLDSLNCLPTTIEGLRTPKEILQRWKAALEGFSDSELLRMKKAFNFFKPADSSEIEVSDLVNAMNHLAYLGVTKKAVELIVKEMSEYPTLNFLEFVTFVERYTTREQADIKEAFDSNANPSTRQVEPRSLFRLLDELGFTTTHLAISECLSFAGFVDSLDLQDLAVFLALHRAREGFTEQECINAKEVFASVSRMPSGKHFQPEMPINELINAVGQLLGSRMNERCRQLLSSTLHHIAADDDGCHRVSSFSRSSAIDFGDFMAWARRTRISELQMLLKAFKRADITGHGIVPAGKLIRCLPTFGSTLLEGQLRDLLAEVTSNEELNFDDFQRFYAHCCESEGFTEGELAELSAVFRKFDADNSGNIEVLELLDVLLYMGYSTTLDTVYRLIKVIDRDCSGELDFKEFLALMRLHKQEELKVVKSAFYKHSQQTDVLLPLSPTYGDEVVKNTLHRTSCAFVLKELFYFPGSKQVQAILEKIGNPEELTFDGFYIVASLSRQVYGAELRRSAGFAEKHVDLLAAMYEECGGSQDQGIDRGGLTRMLKELEIQIKSNEDRDELFGALPAARLSAKAASLSEQDVRVEGSLNISFMTLLHLLRLSTKRSQRRIIAREIKAMEEVGLSNEEVSEFREVFNTMLKKKRSRAEEEEENSKSQASVCGRRSSCPAAFPNALAATLSRNFAHKREHCLAELKDFLCVSGRGPLINVHDVVLLLRTLGIKLISAQKAKLTEEASRLALLVEEGDAPMNVDPAGSQTELDFASFLFLMRWLLDSNFADINSCAAGLTRRQPSKF